MLTYWAKSELLVDYNSNDMTVEKLKLLIQMALLLNQSIHLTNCASNTTRAIQVPVKKLKKKIIIIFFYNILIDF